MSGKYKDTHFHYFFAVDGPDYRRFADVLKGQDILISAIHLLERKDRRGGLLELVKAHDGDTMLDSGAFTNFRAPGSISYEEWEEFVKANLDWLDQYVMFDDIGSRARTVKNYERALKAGLKPMFVDHLYFNTERARVDAIWKREHKVAIGGFGMVQHGKGHEEIPRANRLANLKMRATKGREVDTFCHLLAVGSLRKYWPFWDRVHSVDSAGWSRASSYGHVIFHAKRKVGEVEVPVLVVRDHPAASRRQIKRDMEPELKAHWRKLLAANRWERDSQRTQSQKVSLLETKRYIEAMRKEGGQVFAAFKALEDGQVEKALEVELLKFMDEDDLGTALIIPDLDPRDASVPACPDVVTVESLEKAAETLAAKRPEMLHPVHDVNDSPVKVDDVVEHLDAPMILRRDAITFGGDLAASGTTDGPLLMDLHGPFGPEVRQAIVRRMYAALPPQLASRLRVTDNDMGAPFSDYVPLFDLALLPSRKHEPVRMAVSVDKADDPLMEYPPARTPRAPAIVQYHFRGKSLHVDLRIQVAPDYLVGWTLAMQRPGRVPDVETVEDGKRVAASFSPTGSRYTKPLDAPNRVRAVPKGKHDVKWLDLKEGTTDLGEPGSTSEKEGVFVAVDEPVVEYGLQSAAAHEYFLTRSKAGFNGVLFLRRLRGQEGDYWVASLLESALPGVLKPSAVSAGDVPPQGVPAMPLSLASHVPPEHRFWLKRDEAERRRVRDELVESGLLTEDTVKLVDGKFSVVQNKAATVQAPRPRMSVAAKAMLDSLGVLTEEQEAEAALVLETSAVEKADDKPRDLKQAPRYSLLWAAQADVDPSRPTRIDEGDWLLVVERPGGAFVWRLYSDPDDGYRTGGTLTMAHGTRLLDYDGPVKPGTVVDGVPLNTGSSDVDLMVRGRGRVDILTNADRIVRLRFLTGRLRGLFTVTREGPAEDEYWSFGRGRYPARHMPEWGSDGAVPTVDGVQQWELGDSDAMGRSQLRPLARLNAQDPAQTLHSVTAAMASSDSKKALLSGVRVEPEYNGHRVTAQRAGDKVAIFAGDGHADYASAMPSLVEAMKALPGDCILDGELILRDANGAEVPGHLVSDLAADGKLEDADAELRVFDALYLPDSGPLCDLPQSSRSEMLDGFLGSDSRDRIVRVLSQVAHSEADLRQAVVWAIRQAGSVGAVLKRESAGYTLSGRTSAWQRLRLNRELHALVCDKEASTREPGAVRYRCAVGPVPSDGSGEWGELCEHGGERYAVLGLTPETKVTAEPGDVLRVEASELLDDRGGRRRRLRWFRPVVIERTDAAPTTLDEFVGMLEDVEVAKHLGDSATARDMPIFKGQEERFVLGVVLEPDVVDAHGDTYSAEEVRKAAHWYMENGRNRGLMHQQIVNGQVTILETYIAPVDFKFGAKKVKKGTWLLGLRVLDSRIWRDIRSKSLTGLSIGGIARKIPVKA